MTTMNPLMAEHSRRGEMPRALRARHRPAISPSPELAETAPTDVTLPIMSSVSHAVPRSASFHDVKSSMPGRKHHDRAEDRDDDDVDLWIQELRDP
jgi:hypothetical protein